MFLTVHYHLKYAIIISKLSHIMKVIGSWKTSSTLPLFNSISLFLFVIWRCNFIINQLFLWITKYSVTNFEHCMRILLEHMHSLRFLSEFILLCLNFVVFCRCSQHFFRAFYDITLLVSRWLTNWVLLSSCNPLLLFCHFSHRWKCSFTNISTMVVGVDGL